MNTPTRRLEVIWRKNDNAAQVCRRLAGFGLTTGMRTDGGPGGCLTSRARIAAWELTRDQGWELRGLIFSGILQWASSTCYPMWLWMFPKVAAIAVPPDLMTLATGRSHSSAHTLHRGPPRTAHCVCGNPDLVLIEVWRSACVEW